MVIAAVVRGTQAEVAEMMRGMREMTGEDVEEWMEAGWGALAVWRRAAERAREEAEAEAAAEEQTAEQARVRRHNAIQAEMALGVARDAARRSERARGEAKRVYIATLNQEKGDGTSGAAMASTATRGTTGDLGPTGTAPDVQATPAASARGSSSVEARPEATVSDREREGSSNGSINSTAAADLAAMVEQPHREQEACVSTQASDQPPARSHGKRRRTNMLSRGPRLTAAREAKREMTRDAAELADWLSDDETAD
jgi:hypothetical protein